MPTLTAKGQLPAPIASDNNNVPADLLALATRLDAILGIEAFTTAGREALATAQKWDGRVIWNSTAGEHQGWNAATSLWQSIGGGGGSWGRTFAMMGA